MADSTELSSADVEKLVEMLKEQGGPTDDDLLLMEYHIATLDHAEDNPHLQHLHTITKARFVARYGDLIQTMRNAHAANRRDMAAAAGGSTH